MELVVLTPPLLLFVLLTAYGGRLSLARQSVQAAAAEAARSASISRTASAATANARAAALATLTSEGVHCLNHTVSVDVSAFERPVGSPGAVRVHLDCTVNLSDLNLPGLPGTRIVSAEVDSPLDTYRER